MCVEGDREWKVGWRRGKGMVEGRENEREMRGEDSREKGHHTHIFSLLSI